MVRLQGKQEAVVPGDLDIETYQRLRRLAQTMRDKHIVKSTETLR